MPKKTVNKVKKAKGGKGKKDGKQDSKADKETDIEKAKDNAALWELRLKVTDQSLGQSRDQCYKLARTNQDLIDQLYRAERDALDIADFQRRKDAAKDEKIDMLQKSLKRQEALAREEQNKLVEHYTLQISEMQELFSKKSSDFDMIQARMKEIEEFQKMKAQMEQELSDIRENMAFAEKEHRENLNKMEYKFFIEKARLEKEAETQIALVLEKAHNEAIEQLDDASRSIFKENVRVNEVLKHHIKKEENLQKLANSLAKENASLVLDKNTFELRVKMNEAQMEAQKAQNSKLRAKIASLEKALKPEEKSEEAEREKETKTLVSVQAELEKLQKVLAMRERELGRIKQVAGTIVEQRTEMEQFFHQTLSQVRQEIMASRQKYKKEALQAYRWSMREATAGKLKFPPIRTFNKNSYSTNSVYSDMEEAARWTHPPGSKVDISDLTWEQKEQLLRLLFAKMNRQKDRTANQHLPFSASSEKKSLIDSDAAGITEELSQATFITQAPQPLLPSNPNSLPDIHTT